MKLLKGMLATSHVDLHDERMVYEALVSMVDQINSQYIPVGVEHDPRIPPQGRIKSASLVELEENEYGVEGIIELFEENDNIEPIEDSRVIPIRDIINDSIHIIYDRTYRDIEDQQVIEEIKSLVNGGASEEGKKAVEPISILAVVVTAAAGSFFAGFLEKAGADAWDFFKEKIKSLIRRKRNSQRDYLLSFQFIIREPSKYVVVETILSNPNDNEIEEFFESGIALLDNLVPKLFPKNVDIRKIVIEYSEGKLRVLYSIRKDAVPLFYGEEP